MTQGMCLGVIVGKWQSQGWHPAALAVISVPLYCTWRQQNCDGGSLGILVEGRSRYRMLSFPTFPIDYPTTKWCLSTHCASPGPSLTSPTLQTIKSKWEHTFPGLPSDKDRPAIRGTLNPAENTSRDHSPQTETKLSMHDRATSTG